jgi:hypothetical protein
MNEYLFRKKYLLLNLGLKQQLMRTNMTFYKTLAYTIIASFIFASCVRERDTDMVMIEEQTLGEFIYHNAFEIAEDAASKSTGDQLSNYKTAGYCASITHNKLSNPRTIIIDFGNTNCLCNDNHNRKGKILVSYTGNVFTEYGSSSTISFDNYYIDNNQVFGMNAVRHEAPNLLGQPVFAMAISGKLLKPNTLDTLTWNATRNRIWTAGYTTPVYSDDMFELTGNGSGTSSNFGYYTMNITKPILKSSECRYFTSGNFDLQPQGKSLRIVDYGKGDCDDKATAELNTKTFSIQL